MREKLIKSLRGNVMFLLFVINGMSWAQEENKFEWGIDGQLVFTTNGTALFTSFGGPGLKLNFKKCAVSFNMMPSLKFEAKEGFPLVTTALGTGPSIYFLKKRFVLSFPAYYSVASHSWTFSAGVGYVLKRQGK